MESRARIRPLSRRVACLAALVAAVASLLAGAAASPAPAAKKRKVAPPVVTSISPKRAAVGDTLTIRGRNFLRGVNKNTVVFKRDGQRAVFVKAKYGTSKLLRVVLPVSLKSAMSIVQGAPAPARFRVRVLARRFGKRFTPLGMSPVIGPEAPPAPPRTTQGAADGDCDGDGALNASDADDDNDGIADALEPSLGLQPCNFDSDGDKVADGFEYRSAIDLNDDEYQQPQSSLPYPGKRPYPNPLDASDAGTDFDGDSLTLTEEYKLWQYTLRGATGAPDLGALSYSDGLRYSIHSVDGAGRRVPALAAGSYDKRADFLNWISAASYASVVLPDENPAARALLDVDRDGSVSAQESVWLDNGDGYLSDNERDEDADGLSNFQEAHGELSGGSWWSAYYPRETPFHIAYAGTKLDDADSDGDGVRDGADDQDHDDYPNLLEVSRRRVTHRPLDPPDLDKGLANPDPWWGRVQPFNPCEPNIESRTCPFYVTTTHWAPFDGPAPATGPFAGDERFDARGDDPYYLVRN